MSDGVLPALVLWPIEGVGLGDVEVDVIETEHVLTGREYRLSDQLAV